jgi:hypothetical protein
MPAIAATFLPQFGQIVGLDNDAGLKHILLYLLYCLVMLIPVLRFVFYPPPLIAVSGKVVIILKRNKFGLLKIAVA